MRVPDGFVLAREGVLVRASYAKELSPWLEPLAEASAGGREMGGRGGSRRATLADGSEIFIRRYRHGGLLRGLLGDVYWGDPPRPWRELEVTRAAGRAGVPVPEVLAAAALPLGRAWPLRRLYRAVLVTRAVSGRRPLGAVLQQAESAGERRAWIECAMRGIRRLHEAGIHHPDLNVTNLLAGSDPSEPMAVIDFDRATARRSAVGPFTRWLARRRVARSIAKLGLPGLTHAEAAALLVPILGRSSP